MFRKIKITGMTLDEAMDVLDVTQGNETKAEAVFRVAKTRVGEKIQAQRELVKGKRTGTLKKLK